MKIGFLSHSDLSIYYFRAPIMRELKRRGHDVCAIIPDGAYAEKIRAEFNTTIYDLDKASLNPLTIAKNTANLAKKLSGLNLDVLQTAAHKSNVFGTLSARLAGVKVVLNLVEGLGTLYVKNDAKTRVLRALMELLYKFSLARGDACIFVNDADPDYFISRGIIAPNKVRRIKSVGVNSAKFDPASVIGYDFGDDRKVVLMVARALRDKGIVEFYEAAEILKDRNDAQFVFVGDQDAGNKSSVSAEFLSSGRVRWIKWNDEIAQMMKSAYLYALPSYKEGFARTILEAMSMEKACVASDACAEEVENGINGLVCQTRDARDLAAKISVLLDDADLTARLGKAGREMVLARYDEKIIVQKYMDVYKEFFDV